MLLFYVSNVGNPSGFSDRYCQKLDLVFAQTEMLFAHCLPILRLWGSSSYLPFKYVNY